MFQQTWKTVRQACRQILTLCFNSSTSYQNEDTGFTSKTMLHKQLQGNNFSLHSTNCFVILSSASAAFSLWRYKFYFFLFVCVDITLFSRNYETQWPQNGTEQKQKIFLNAARCISSYSGFRVWHVKDIMARTLRYSLSTTDTTLNILINSWIKHKEFKCINSLSDSFPESKSTSQEQNYGSKKTCNYWGFLTQIF